MKLGHRLNLSLVTAHLAISSAGCTLVGAGIGNTIARPGTLATPADIRTVPRGTDVTVVYRAPEPNGNVSLRTLEGVYRGAEEDRAFIERGHEAYGIPISRIEHTCARPPSGSYSLEGGLIGLGLDIAAGASLFLLVSQWGGR